MTKQKFRVLLIEDDPGDADLLQEILEEGEGQQFDLTWVDRLKHGLAQLDQDNIDLILLDLSLPDASGLEGFTRLQNQYPMIPVVVLSGLDDEVVTVNAVQAGAQDYLIKGEVDGYLLVRSMRYAIERKRAEIALRKAHDDLEIRVELRTMELSKAIEQLRQEIVEREEAEAALQNYADRLQTLHEIDRVIREAQSPQAVAQAALYQLQHLIPCQHIDAVMFDFENGYATILALLVKGRPSFEANKNKDEKRRLPLNAFNITEDLKQGQVYEVENVAGLVHLTQFNQGLLKEGIHAFMTVPLLSHGDLVGILNLGKDSLGHFERVQVEIAGEVANQVALAIQQARLYEQVQRHANQLECHVQQLQLTQEAEREQRKLAEALREVGIALSATLDFEELLDSLLDQIGRVIPYDTANIMLVEEQHIRVVRTRGYDKFGLNVVRELFSTPLDIATTVNLRRMSETGEALVIPDTNTYPEWMRLNMSEHVQSWAGAPIKVQEQVIAFFSLDKIEANFYCTKHAKHLAAFAGQASVAFENAQLFKQAQQEIAERIRIEGALDKERSLLAQRVAERTMALSTANAELARAVRLKDEFLASMSHELRTPLNAILGLGELFLEGAYGCLTEEQENILRIIERSGRHLLDLINDILDISKIEAGKLSLELSPISVELVCQSSLEFIKQSAHQKQINISTTFDHNVTIMQADERRLKQILVNLLHNAVKFTPEKGAIGLDMIGDKVNQTVHFVVWDTGIGISQNDMKRLFQPFTQLDSSLSRQHTGTGLGLALVSRLTEMHGGSVKLESKPSMGSRFTISLPWRVTADEILAHNNDAVTALEAVPLAIPPDSYLDKKILLAEDNPDNVILIVHYLQRKGYEVVVARNGAEAIKQIQEKEFDLVLMDIQMPEVDGFEAIRRIRAHPQPQKATIPIIALTALAMSGDREQCLAVGADNYLSKPLNLKQLLKMLESYTSSRNLIRPTGG